MKVNNFDLLSQFLDFENETKFYFIEILQRKKDDNNCESVNSNYRILKVYYIRSLDELERRKPKIIELCEANNARAYLYLNVRDSEQVSWTCLEVYTKLIKNHNTNHGYTVWDHSCSSTPYKVKHWMIDVDTHDEVIIQSYIELVNAVRGEEGNRLHCKVPTPNGCHLITGKFDVAQFCQMCAVNNLPKPDIKKDSPTLLYY